MNARGRKLARSRHFCGTRRQACTQSRRLITRRSQVQILPPLLREAPETAPFAFDEQRNCYFCGCFSKPVQELERARKRGGRGVGPSWCSRQARAVVGRFGAETRNIRSQTGSTDVAAANRTKATPAAPSTSSMPVHVHGFCWAGSELPWTHEPPLSLARR